MFNRALIIGSVLFITTLSIYFLSREKEVDFNTQVKPILNKRCVACHGGVKKAGEISFLFANEAINTKGKSGKTGIVPGDAEHSEFYKRIISKDPEDRMPKNEEELPEEEIEILKKWIDQGAKWGDHWAYTPPQKVDVPAVGSFLGRLGITDDKEVNWVSNDIDHFILDKLKEEHLTPSAKENKSTLLRRTYLDLIGLPPTTKQLNAFLADQSPGAYEKVVDQLLASQHFGEKWAGMWLDLARYADTKGYERDVYRNIWRYRDYVIKAFNQDKPYDQFVVEQLAGDLLPNPTNDQYIATGFHRNTMTNDEGGTVDEEFRVAALIDRVNTTFDVFQGTTMGCVQCHTHPYDPFKHDEYYKLMAFFNQTRDEDVVSETPYLKFYNEKDSLKIVALKSWLNRHANPETRKTTEKFIKVLEPKFNSHDIERASVITSTLLDEKYLGLQHTGLGKLKNVTLTGKNRLLIQLSTGAKKGVLKIYTNEQNLTEFQVPSNKDTVMILAIPELKGKHTLNFSFTNPAEPKTWLTVKWVAFQKALAETDPKAEIQYAEILNAGTDNAPIFIDGEGDLLRKTFVFERGNWLVHGKEVKPDVPSYLGKLPVGYPKNRLGFARWLVDGKNPLTARVAVNRYWEQIFGIGLVETQEDFGTQGFTPSHPELLDYLALKFQNDFKWSSKKILKYIVMSSAYQQSSKTTPELMEADPYNRYLARGPRVRLNAEQIRDQALVVSGLYSPKMYGRSVMPPQPKGLWQSPWNGEDWKNAENEDRYRRALYTYWKRTSPYPSMTSFDAPSREFCQIRRIRTNTPLQALVTLNDPVYVECAIALGRKMKNSKGKVSDKIRSGFKEIMKRDISNDKLAILEKTYNESLKSYKKSPEESVKLLKSTGPDPELAALSVAANVMLNLDEVITKE
ncbi:DUF1553 domain-containing protein [Emticicia sp. CRIBPO]|uniref:PSD1 and planctomycete cytochrome C domain-containing protein n=1 Tax=Emticicia sp. CRIBPO TaxID=2683258 RepID=UPI001411FA88|nr:PSD1 and planctomycete cytochrome C domain-containing protein [Emticicia sp. CRIBPO]NBA84476.1 DUF1553 domain-containing protein [Emticicia sp. CRIBPO]